MMSHIRYIITLICVCHVCQTSAEETTIAFDDTTAQPTPAPEWTTWQAWECSPGLVWKRYKLCEGGSCEGNPPHEYHTMDFPETCAMGTNEAIWEPWSDWTRCSVSCGNGTQLRVRNCTSPADNIRCVGDYHMTRSCQKDPCPVNGTFVRWKEWSECSKTCGGGRQTRLSVCTLPLYNGSRCDVPPSEERDCNTVLCPGWSEWSEWTACSMTCTRNGRRRRMRTCNRHGQGQGCQGKRLDVERCNSRRCPIDGGWGEWSSWTCYHRPCDPFPGKMERSRSCNSPKPKYRGKKCVGDEIQRFNNCTKKCYDDIDGQWCLWNAWTPCNNNKQIRSRECKCPQPFNDGSCLKPTAKFDILGNCKDESYPCRTTRPLTNMRDCEEPFGSGAGAAGGSGDGSQGDQEKN